MRAIQRRGESLPLMPASRAFLVGGAEKRVVHELDSIGGNGRLVGVNRIATLIKISTCKPSEGGSWWE